MEIYLDKPFLDLFLKHYDAENDLHRNLRKFLKRADIGKIYFDFKYDSVEEFELAISENPFIDEILNVGSVKPTDDFKSQLFEQTFYEDSSASKIFLIETPAELSSIEKMFGCIAVNFESIEKIAFLFEYNVEGLTKRTSKIPQYPTNWQFIEKYKYPCNAMIITDNYLLNPQEFAINLIEVFNYLMPNELKIPFHLTIIGKDSKSNVNNQQVMQNLDEYFKEKYKYKVIIKLVNEEFHDRYLITNYITLNSGIGFGIFSNRRNVLTVKNDSRLYYHGLAYNNKSFKQAFELTKMDCFRKNNIENYNNAGNNLNRLFFKFLS